MQRKQIKTTNAPEAIGPYSQAVTCNNMLYSSGQIAINPSTGKIESEDIEDQTRQVMKNIGAVLTEAGADFDSILKCVIYLTNLDDFAKVNSIYAEYFKAPYPARATVEVSKLPKAALLEIEITAQL